MGLYDRDYMRWEGATGNAGRNTSSRPRKTRRSVWRWLGQALKFLVVGALVLSVVGFAAFHFRNDYPVAAKVANWLDVAWARVKTDSARVTAAIRPRQASLPAELLSVEKEIAEILNGGSGTEMQDLKSSNPLRAKAAQEAIAEKIANALQPLEKRRLRMKVRVAAFHKEGDVVQVAFREPSGFFDEDSALRLRINEKQAIECLLDQSIQEAQRGNKSLVDVATDSMSMAFNASLSTILFAARVGEEISTEDAAKLDVGDEYECDVTVVAWQARLPSSQPDSAIMLRHIFLEQDETMTRRLEKPYVEVFCEFCKK